MLYIIGLGLGKGDMTAKGIEALQSCKTIFLETYTSVISDEYVREIEKIAKQNKAKLIKADRKMVEESNEIIQKAKKEKVALLVSGDPLSATTHIELLMRAKKENVRIKVIHSVSIFTAVAETGLQLYKFGKTGSIAKWQPSFKPESFYDIIKENKMIGAHTLLLIDIGLSVHEALEYIDSIAKTRDSSMLNEEIIIFEKAGTEDSRITIGKIPSLLKKKFALPACIIIPGKLHFMEQEMLEKYKKALTKKVF